MNVHLVRLASDETLYAARFSKSQPVACLRLSEASVYEICSRSLDLTYGCIQ